MCIQITMKCVIPSNDFQIQLTQRVLTNSKVLTQQITINGNVGDSFVGGMSKPQNFPT